MSAQTIIGTSLTTEQSITLSPEELSHHLHVMGKSGTGKTEFLLNLIKQDIERGNGSFILDPFGEYTMWARNSLPAHRAGDAVLVDPTSLEDGEQKFAQLDLRSVIEQNKILILNLQRSALPDDNVRAKLGQVALKAISQALLQRKGSVLKPFTIYLDEAQDWWCNDLRSFLSEGEKGVKMVLGHQYLAPYEEKLLDLMFSSLSTCVVLSVGKADAEHLAKRVIPDIEKRLTSLEPHQGILRRLSGEIEQFKALPPLLPTLA